MLNNLLMLVTKTAGFILATVGLGGYYRSADDIRFVFYHGIGDRSSSCMKYLKDEISQEVFEAHLDYLQEKYNLLSLEDAINYLNTGCLTNDKPVCSISFDDGLYSVYSIVFPILKQRNIPFTVFLNTVSIDNNSLLWLHALNYLLSAYGEDKVATEINHLIDGTISKVPTEASGIEHWCRSNFEYFYEANILNVLLEKFELSIEEIARQQNLYLNWQHVEEMSSHNVTFYSHTHKHFPLNAFSKQQYIEQEIDAAKNILKDHNISDYFISFPFGMEVDYGKRAKNYALLSGYRYVVEVGAGLNSPSRILNGKMISRVGLGSIGSASTSIYSAIELFPIVKKKLKLLLGKI